MNLQSTPYSELMPHGRNLRVSLNPLKLKLPETVSLQDGVTMLIRDSKPDPSEFRVLGSSLVQKKSFTAGKS